MRKVLHLILFLVFFFTVMSQDKEEIVRRMKDADTAEASHVGFGGMESQLYKDFERLRALSSERELLQWFYGDHPVLTLYTGWALIDRKYREIPWLMDHLMKNDREVSFLDGCLEIQDLLSEMFYLHYYRKIPEDQKSTDPALYRMDSLVIHRIEQSGYALGYPYENRIYPRHFLPRISYLASQKGNTDAKHYLEKWHKAEYEESVNHYNRGKIKKAVRK